MGLYEMDITWEVDLHEDDFEDDIERIVMSVDKKTHDTMFVTVYNLYDLDINRINQLFESDGFEIYHYKSPYVPHTIIGKILKGKHYEKICNCSGYRSRFCSCIC